MKYSNKQETIHVYLDKNVIYMGDTAYKIDKIYSHPEEKSKFCFGRYVVKIINGKLSLCDSNTFKLIKTYIKDDSPDTGYILSVDNPPVDTVEAWEKYIIKKNTYMEINHARTTVIINEKRCDIVSHHKIGGLYVYVTHEDVIKLSDQVNTWNNISMMKIST